MARREKCDSMIVGREPNGVTPALYLAKFSNSVCVLEERREDNGAIDTAEPFPGMRLPFPVDLHLCRYDD